MAYQSFSAFPATPPDARKLQAVVLACLGDAEGAAEALGVYMSSQPDWSLADERALWEGVWVVDDALEQWLDALRSAGLADG